MAFGLHTLQEPPSMSEKVIQIEINFAAMHHFEKKMHKVPTQACKASNDNHVTHVTFMCLGAE
jgi:hypothetical protein